MTQAYSNPERALDPHALPDVEVFYAERGDFRDADDDVSEAGWYWWACFPGCIPEGEANGPFDTEAEAIADAQAESIFD
jgi:hypothetical protein